MASLSRQLAQWVVGLRYDDLPPAVVDRAKGVTLYSLASVLLGSQGGEAFYGRVFHRQMHHEARARRAPGAMGGCLEGCVGVRRR
jgi:hypothetical protein